MVTDANAAGGTPVSPPRASATSPVCLAVPMAPAAAVCQHRRHDVRRATEADVDPMAAQLCRAFFDDPVIGHVFRNAARRTEGMRRYFTTQMRGDYFPYGGCYTTDDHMARRSGARPASPC